MFMAKNYLIAFVRLLSAILFLVVILWAANFPYNTDAPLTSTELAAARKYYTEIYMKPANDAAAAETDYDRKYQAIAEQMTERFEIVE